MKERTKRLQALFCALAVTATSVGSPLVSVPVYAEETQGAEDTSEHPETENGISQLLCDGKTPADLPYQTFDNGIVTINTETAEALGLDLAALKEAFKPYCTEICEVTTAENFS